MIGTRIKLALDGQRVARNKVWLDFLVQKSNHKGDAVNVVDTICDAIKGVIDLDDRWFAIRRLDWEIVKFEPKIYLGIGQESAVDVQACLSCGRLLEYENFSKHKSNLHGISRNCRECVKGSAR